MTKTKIALLAAGACTGALFVFALSLSDHRNSGGVSPDRSTGLWQLVWDQPPGVPPTGSGPKPKRVQQLAWDQPPGVPPTGSGTRPKGSA